MDLDGYRCNAAGFVPTDFWNTVRRELDAIKPVFMPAEWESRDLHAETFDMTYAWSWYETMHRIAMGKADLEQLKVYYAWNDKAYPRGVMRMTFVSNHDKNSWEGTEFEQFGDALEAAIGAAVVGEGMPLIYSGQEAGNDRWLESSSGIRSCGASTRRANCIESCLRSGAPNTALWNARWGARMINAPNSMPASVFRFVRRNQQDKMFAVLNLSPEARTVTFSESLCHGADTDYLANEPIKVDGDTALTLDAWSARIFVQ